MKATFPRSWFRFSLRTCFILLTAVCVWVGYQVNWIRQRHDALRKPSVSQFADSVVLRAPGGLWLFGEEGHERLAVYGGIEEQELKKLHSLFPESQIEDLSQIDSDE